MDNFIDDWPDDGDPVEPPQPTFDDIPLRDRPRALTEAALGGCVGGSFAPGIEAGSKMAEAQTYQQPFRISSEIEPGDLTQDLSVPWQADFLLTRCAAHSRDYVRRCDHNMGSTPG